MLKKNIKLPENFAERVLDLETNIEMGQFQIEDVDRLLELYSEAVQYYNSIVDKKYLHYEHKMQ